MRFKLLLLCSACSISLLLLSGCGKPSDTASKDKSTEPTETTASLDPSDIVEAQTQKFDDAVSEFMDLYRETDEDDRQSLVEEKFPQASKYVAPLMQVVDEHPDSDAAVDALLWIVKRSRDEAGETASKKLLNDYIHREELKEICMMMSFQSPSAKTHSALQKLINVSPHDSVKGTATFAMANYLCQCKSALEESETEDQQGSPQESNSTGEFLASLDVSDSAIKSLYQTVIDDYPGVRPYQTSNRKLKRLAEGAIFEMEKLAIGKEAPDIEGKDLDGVDFKLSEYRGKVVVIDFWGDW